MKVRLPEGAKRAPAGRAPRKRGLIRCPQCRSHRLSAEMAFIGGAKYHCADCGFRGALVVTDDDEGAPGGDPGRGGEGDRGGDRGG